MLILNVAIIVLLIITLQIQYQNSKEAVHQTLGSNAVHIAKTISRYIDEDDLKNVKQTLEEDTTYWSVREQLNSLREHNGVLYAYTITKDSSGKLMFLVDGMPSDNTEDVGGVGTQSSVPLEVIEEADKKGIAYSGIEKTKFGSYITGIITLKDANGSTYAYLGVDIDAEHVTTIADEVAGDVIPKLLLVFLIFLVVGLGGLFMYVKRTLKPINTLVASVHELAKGDIHTALKTSETINLKTKNEITLFTKSYNEALRQLTVTFNEVHIKTSQWKKSLEAIQVAAENVEQSNVHISTSVQEIAQGSTLQQKNNEEIVTAMNDMAIGIQQLANTSSDIVDSSYDMKQLVEQGVQHAEAVMKQIASMEASVLTTSKHVQEMTDRSVAMNEMITVITSIADQTNLLALNASIEAARAGEHGKGFAVVADEVRKLAEMSRNSASDIGEHLTGFLAMTERAQQEMNTSARDVIAGSEAVKQIGEQLVLINQAVKTVNEKILSDSAVIEEMSAGSEEILASAEDMNGLVKHNVVETNSVANETEIQVEVAKALTKSVTELEQTSNNIINEIEKFKI
jgi:methyl-accepting chemotaxis protein